MDSASQSSGEAGLALQTLSLHIGAIPLRGNLAAQDRTSVKLCDFGSAMFQGENEVTPYLVSRYYRAPEVILGLKYGEWADSSPSGLQHCSRAVAGFSTAPGL